MTALIDEALKAKVQLAGAAAENADVIATLVRSKLDFRADGTVKVLDAAGNVRIGRSPDFSDMTIDELVAEIAATKPVLFGKASTTPSETSTTPPAEQNHTAKAIREAKEARHRRQSGPVENPFAKGSINVTAQVLMQARDPAMAARLKAEASD